MTEINTKPETELKNSPTSAVQRSKRLARTDMHTLLAGEFAKVKALQTTELVTILNGDRFHSKELLQATQIELVQRLRADRSNRETILSRITDSGLREDLRRRTRLDPEDQDSVEV
jgi:hypothetical protein